MSDQDMKRRIGELVSEATAHMGLSRNELAKRSGVAPNTLYAFEHGKSWPQPARMRAITDALGWRPRAVQQLLDSDRDPATVNIDDMREPNWGEGWPSRSASDLSDEELLAELTMRMRLKNQDLRKMREQSNVVPLRFDEAQPHAAHPDMPRDADRYPVDLGEEPQD